MRSFILLLNLLYNLPFKLIENSKHIIEIKDESSEN